jgi:hypothetical protein
MPADFMAGIKEKFDSDDKREYYQEKEQERIAQTGRLIAVGNCQEHAALTYIYLRDVCVHRPRSLEVMHTSDHAFVVIGREKPNAVPGRQWGLGAVICDAYYNEVYAYTGELNKRQSGAKFYMAGVMQ